MSPLLVKNGDKELKEQEKDKQEVKNNDEYIATCCLIGLSGSGKSSFGNCLLQFDLFKVSHDNEPLTLKAELRKGIFLENYGNNDNNNNNNKLLKVIDMPGFDGKNCGPNVIKDMKYLNSGIDKISTFTMVINGNKSRVEPLISLIKIYGKYLSNETFEKMLNNLSVVFTHWSYDKKSIKKRKEKGITREMRINQINGELKNAFAKYYNKHNQVPCFFMDNETLDDDDCHDNEKIQVADELERYFESINDKQKFLPFKIILKPHAINQGGNFNDYGTRGTMNNNNENDDDNNTNDECITKRCLIILLLVILFLLLMFIIVYFSSF